MTVREHLNAIRERCEPYRGVAHTADAHEHAVAALAEWDRLLDRLAHAERGISFLGDSKSILQQIIEAES